MKLLINRILICIPHIGVEIDSFPLGLPSIQFMLIGRGDPNFPKYVRNDVWIRNDCVNERLFEMAF